MKGISHQRNSLPNNLSISSFSFFLISEEIDGCALGVVLGIKYDEVDERLAIVEGDADGPFSFPLRNQWL